MLPFPDNVSALRSPNDHARADHRLRSHVPAVWHSRATHNRPTGVSNRRAIFSIAVRPSIAATLMRAIAITVAPNAASFPVREIVIVVISSGRSSCRLPDGQTAD